MKLWHCNKAHVYDIKEEFLCEAEVVGDVEESAKLVFDGSYDQVLRTDVIVVFLDGVQGLVSCECVLSDYEEVAVPDGRIKSSVLCKIVAQREVIQRRQDIKLPVEIDAVVKFTGEEGQVLSTKIQIWDISAGGFFCSSKTKWDVEQVISFVLLGQIPLEAEILREQTLHSYNERFEMDDSRYGYGCRFINLSRAAEAWLRRFVFQQEVIQRKCKAINGTES